MISSHTLGEIQVQEAKQPCHWPGCSLMSNAHGWCDLHRLRVKRGWEPGTETAWERVLAAFARLLEADTEDDAEYDRLEKAAKRAAESYRRARRATRRRTSS